MKERPILFTGPTVGGLLSGRKTQTRRVVKGSEQWPASAVKAVMLESRGTALAVNAGRCTYGPELKSPYGQPGDRLWVRETFADLQGTGIEHRPISSGPLQRYAFAADAKPGSHGDEARKEFGVKWKPSIFMPRAASRITLEITSVRVERLQDISESDAIAEGIEPLYGAWRDYGRKPSINYHPAWAKAIESYRSLWEAINGPDSWAANPWVWVVEFKLVSIARAQKTTSGQEE